MTASAGLGQPSGELAPIAPAEREPVLDVLRGVAVLGILLINIEYMRGSDFYAALLGEPLLVAPVDRAAQFMTGWLAAGKFLSSFAILFGIGAALIADRAARAGRVGHAGWSGHAGRSAQSLLGRRYGLLLVVGLAHMVLLFPGDILLLYGLTGVVMLAFMGVEARTALRWAAGLLVVMTLLLSALTTLTVLGPDSATRSPMDDFVARLRDQAIAAYGAGSYLDLVGVHAAQALLIQGSQLVLLPWVLALFLLGLAVVRLGVLRDLRAHRGLLRHICLVGLGLGLPANLVLGLVGPLWMIAPLEEGAAWLVPVAAVAQFLGAPLLAAGYLAGVVLVTLRFGVARRLAATGRMALSAYLAQSVLALLVFGGLGLYDRLGSVQALVVVGGIWLVLLVACPLWMARFQYGPVEWLWRSLTYGRRQPLRQPRS